MEDSTQQTPASEHDGFIYGLESFVFDGKELGLISNDGLDWGGDEPSTNKIWAAQKRSAPVKEIEENPGTSEIEFDLIELKPANLVQVMGGTTSKNGKKWNAPSKRIKLEGPLGGRLRDRSRKGFASGLSARQVRLFGRDEDSLQGNLPAAG